MNFKSALFFLALAMTGCGDNQMNGGKTRERADERTRTTESEKAEIIESSRILKVALGNMFQTKSFQWTFLGLVSSQQSAAKLCSDLSRTKKLFELPVSTELAEVYEGDESWKKFGPFTKEGGESQKGSVVLCRRPIENSQAPSTP